MRREGVEPSRTDVPRILSPVRLPIPPPTLKLEHLIKFKNLGALDDFRKRLSFES